MAYDIKRMYAQAKGFQLAAERCLEEREHPEQKWLPIQAIVCYAFSCEIYLKAIYTYEHPDSACIQGHYLDELFNSISEESKTEIEHELLKSYSRDKIAQFICESRKIFEEFRYVYERDSDDRENIGFVCVFAEALEKLVGKMIWKTVFQMAGIEDKI